MLNTEGNHQAARFCMRRGTDPLGKGWGKHMTLPKFSKIHIKSGTLLLVGEMTRGGEGGGGGCYNGNVILYLPIY